MSMESVSVSMFVSNVWGRFGIIVDEQKRTRKPKLDWKGFTPFAQARDVYNGDSKSNPFPEPANFLRRMFDENEGSGKDQFLGDPDWLSEKQYNTISPLFADYQKGYKIAQSRIRMTFQL